ncbi:MAG: hypothetical protein KAX57_07555 [Rhodoferax sp.]|jgi:hypothetical protein|uniref:hypothetical protein n=1 Tax=Rhodoferax sp. TaxID=50421 RepID=UPI001B5F28EB|nr:hypothetical protein [Rhodoferax sp.]MBP8286682.1 hypothetical protein [Rhodoferax sp.]MBP9147953.1 hypothetical protein [Rhodoferax sp.]MBP9736737.1 hypothetical protein [Rhodoferax sp.]
MNAQPTSSILDQVETHLEQFSAALTSNDIGGLSLATAGLQTLVPGLSQVMRQPASWRADPAVANRLRKITTALAANRESLLRRSVLAERALATLIPSTRSDTYSAGAGARRTYAGFGRQSGEFKVTTA